MTEEVIANEVQTLKDNVKALHKDIKNLRILVKNVETSLASSNDEYTDLDEEDKFSDDKMYLTVTSSPSCTPSSL